MESSYEDLRDQSLAYLRKCMDSLPPKKGLLLAYWIRDYTRFLNKEASFDPKKLIRYKRGSIVKAHLGFRVGSEEGGLHYAVVMDTCSTQSSTTVTIIPFTSVKPTTDLGNLHSSRLYIGDEIYQALQKKTNTEIQSAIRLQTNLARRIEENRKIKIDIDAEDAKTQLAEQRVVTEALSREITALSRKVTLCEKMKHEIQKMNRGSIALVGQITTISKLRIYDPMYPSDTLSNIRLCDATMDRLDQKVRELFTKVSESCPETGNNS